MKKFWICFWLLLFSCRAFAIDEGDTKYVGGTASGFSDGTIGKLDTHRGYRPRLRKRGKEDLDLVRLD